VQEAIDIATQLKQVNVTSEALAAASQASVNLNLPAAGISVPPKAEPPADPAAPAVVPTNPDSPVAGAIADIIASTEVDQAALDAAFRANKLTELAALSRDELEQRIAEVDTIALAKDLVAAETERENIRGAVIELLETRIKALRTPIEKAIEVLTPDKPAKKPAAPKKPAPKPKKKG
jgi:hypothetical protein